MKTTSLTSNDYGKLFAFALLLVPPTVFGVGAVPFLLLAFGMFMLKKTGDFGHVETACRNYKIYCCLVAVGFAALAMFEVSRADYPSSYRYDTAALLLGFAWVPIFYIVALNFLLLYPLREHREWVEQNGLFPKRQDQQDATGDIDIIKGKRARAFSVADELIKWAKLKEDGHITEQEYNDVRTKLLQKS